MHCKPSLQRNKEFFCNFVSFFQGDTQKAQRGQQNAQTGSGETGDTGGGRSADRTEQEKIAEPAQEHAQEHEQAQLAPAGDAAQEEEQHRGQQTVGRVEDGEQLFPPGPAQHGSQKIVKKAQRQAADIGRRITEHGHDRLGHAGHVLIRIGQSSPDFFIVDKLFRFQ